MTRWHLRDPLITALESFTSEALSSISLRFAKTRNWWFKNRLAEVAAAVLGQKSSQWFRSILDVNPGRQLALLNLAHQCIPREEGMQRAMQSLSSLPQREVARSCLALGSFQDPAVLDWIEKNVAEPLTTHWGQLAALSELDWDRVVRWLERGRPLSLVALDALVTCVGTRKGAPILVQRTRPHLRGAYSNLSIEEALLRHAQMDRSPRVLQAVNYVLRNIESIRP